MKKQKLNKELITSFINSYYEIKDNCAYVCLKYDNLNCLMDLNNNMKQVKLSNQLFNDLSSNLSLLPLKYDINLKIMFSDDKYREDEIKDIILNNIKLYIYKLGLLNFRTLKKALILIFIGIISLLISYFLNDFNFKQIIYDLVNITGTLFIWEGISLYFIELSNEKKKIKRILKKIKKVEIINDKR